MKSGSREENASNQEAGVLLRFGGTMKGSGVTAGPHIPEFNHNRWASGLRHFVDGSKGWY
jgi:hypothetical protein